MGTAVSGTLKPLTLRPAPTPTTRSSLPMFQDKLRALPNEVLEGVEVTAITGTTSKSTCHRFYDGVQHISAYSITTDGNYKDSKGTTNFCEGSQASGVTADQAKVDLLVEFADEPGQTGVQYLLEVDTNAHGAGSFPVSAGIPSATQAAVTVAEVNYNDNLGNLSELSDCSDRGLDAGEGQCECFEGYRGLACAKSRLLSKSCCFFFACCFFVVRLRVWLCGISY